MTSVSFVKLLILPAGVHAHSMAHSLVWINIVVADSKVSI